MSNRFFCFIFLFITLNSLAQRRHVDNLPNFDKPRFHYGFYLGINRNDFKIDYKANSTTDNPDVLVKVNSGFNVGLIADFRLHNNINLRFEPGLMTNSKELIFNHINGTDADRVRDQVGSTFLHLPLVLKFSANRLHNVRPYFLAGISFDHNFSSNQQNADDNSSGQFRMNSTNFMYELGIGIDLYLYFFKFSPSIRAVFAINNEIKYDDISPSQWTDPINYMGTRGIFLHFAFE